MSVSRTLNILVVDDDANNRKLLETMLAADGHRVRNVHSGQAALDALAEWQPDVILLDLMMPGLDGFETAQRLRVNPKTKPIPIVMVTALDDPASQTRLAAIGITDILAKPLDRWALQAVLKRVGEVDREPGTP